VGDVGGRVGVVDVIGRLGVGKSKVTRARTRLARMSAFERSVTRLATSATRSRAGSPVLKSSSREAHTWRSTKKPRHSSWMRLSRMLSLLNSASSSKAASRSSAIGTARKSFCSTGTGA
jgi:hypothetical protein